jgi:hypothetical protein
MKIAIHDRQELHRLPKNTTELHLVRPVSWKDLQSAFNKQKKISHISLSKSCFNRLSKNAKNILKDHNIGIVFETRRGRPIGIALERMLNVIELRKDFQPFRDIEEHTGIPKSTAHYLVKYAVREKIKKGKDTVYLK